MNPTNDRRAGAVGLGSPSSIRLATEADAEAISAFTRRITRDDIARDLPEDARRYLDEALGPTLVRRNMHGAYRYFVAESGGRLTGVVATRDDRHLLLLFVAKEARGQGLARALWECARAACVSNNRSGPFTVSAAPDAVPMYERLGFAPEGPATTEHGITRVPMSTAAQPMA